jgi:KaiC/GvpD/RAD55 family RecA-like ATPase
MRRITGKTLLEKTYPTYGFDGEWMRSLGDVEKHFKMLIYGPSGSGKTRFCMKLALYLTKWGKVYYNSMEQGEGKGLQDVMKWASPTDAQAQKVSIGDREHFDIMLETLESDKQIRFVFIDSLDYMKLTQDQYKFLIEKYPRKSFVIICWSENKKPKSKHAEAIEYMVDIKAYCERGFVHAKSRYAVGNPLPFRIFEQKAASPPMLPSEERKQKKDEGV